MKILHISAVSGGVDTYLKIISNNISDNYEQYIVKNENIEEFSDSKKMILPLKRDISLLSDLKSLKSIISYIKKNNPDVIHLHSAKAGVLGRLAGFVCKKPMLYTPHAFSYLSTNNSFKKILYKNIERFLKHTGNFVLATSNSEAQRAMNDLNYKQRKVILFNNSIKPILPIKDTSEIPFKIPQKFICSIGRPCYQKNVISMVNVFAEVKKQHADLKFVLMGVGHYSPDFDEVKKRVQELNIEDSFIMLPWMERKHTFRIVEKSLLYISTSRYEGLPYAVIEALSLRKACVVSDCDGNRDLIKNDYNGYVINQNRLEELMPEKIISLLNNSDLRCVFEENGFKKFQQEFNILLNIKKLEEIYSKFEAKTML